MASSASAASPTRSTPSTWRSSSARTPARNRAWSSTRNTRTLTAAPGDAQRDLRTLAGGAAHDGVAADAAHPADHAVGQTPAVGRDGVGVEAPAAVAHVGGEGVVFDLDVHVHAVDAGVARRVGGRLPHGGHEGAGGFVEGDVADEHDLDGHLLVVLHLGQLAGEGAAQAGGGGRVGARVVEPVAQLPLLAAGEGGDLPVGPGPVLDQGEGLQDAVVEVGGDLGLLLAADARPPLLGEVVGEAAEPGAEQEGDAGGGDHGAEGAAAGGGDIAGEGGEGDEPYDHEHHADGDPQRGPPVPHQVIGAFRPTPHEHDADGGDAADHRDLVAEPQAPRAQHEEGADHGDEGGGIVDAMGAHLRGGGVGGGQHQPQHGVHGHAHPAGEGQQEQGQAHDVNVEAQAAGHPDGHAGHQPPAPGPGEASGQGDGHRSMIARPPPVHIRVRPG